LELWQAAVLGLVEGITEYLPVSSTGHLIVAGELMGLKDVQSRSAVNAFEIVIQGGAILAVLGLYWSRFVQMLRGVLGRDNAGFALLVNLGVAFVPAAALGFVLHDWIEARFFNTTTVALALAIGGVYMIIVDRSRVVPARFAGPGAPGKGVTDMTPRDALIVGALQCFSLIPGTSRSMMTITGGVLAGLRPTAAAEFSFLLGMPTLLAATAYALIKNLRTSAQAGTPNLFEQLGWAPVTVGIVVAAVSAAVAVHWLVGFLNRRGLTPFGVYRIAAAIVLLALGASGFVRVG
jgi:undecaprenyl-diphosphatase